MSTVSTITRGAGPGAPGGGLRIVAADHPALDRRVGEFLAALATERRYFGPTASSNPKPFPSLLRLLGTPGGFRMAAVADGRVVALVRVDEVGNAHLAVLAGCRGQGIGTMLGRAALERAIALGYRRIVLRTWRRSRATRRIGEALGCVVVDGPRGRTDLIVDLHAGRASA